ncbi:sensor histidine kinase [Micromonospora sp. B9E7]|uniref:sensor histidine kinase n=1 Tax=Micromonospora sp. B9E7 TaxID=3153574 RepID=UPI00325E0547
MWRGGQRGWRWAAADVALALALLVIGLVGTDLAGEDQPGSRPVDAGCRVLIVVAALALTLRHRAPAAVLAVVSVATTIYLVIGYPYGPILLTLLVAVYTVATWLPVRPAALATGGALVLLLTHAFLPLGPASGWTATLPTSAWVVVPFAVGVVVRVNRETAARSLEEEARGRAEQARRQTDEERLRIAQEVHDVVGHGLAAISMQAEIALHLLPKRPEQAETALTAISRTSREALDELRVTLGAVRQGAERGPVPGLARLPALRDRLAGAGLAVDTRVIGDPRELPTAVDLTAYRVVQEALTNVLRHAGVTSAEVTVDYRADEVTVEVTDRGTGAGAAQADEGGHGLAGMRERVAALGGRLAAGPRVGGGFRVYARLPVEPTA